jgi:hypothetical protein
MKRNEIAALAVASLAVLAQVLSGSEEVWRALFWISAIANVVLVMLWYEARAKKTR